MGWSPVVPPILYYPVIIIVAPGSICPTVPMSPPGSTSIPSAKGRGLICGRGSARGTQEASGYCAWPVASLVLQVPGQGSCSSACLGWGMWGCWSHWGWLALGEGAEPVFYCS